MSKNAVDLSKQDQPCPFCGAEPISAMASCEDGEWAVECLHCGASGPPMKEAGEAIDAWNTRNGVPDAA